MHRNLFIFLLFFCTANTVIAQQASRPAIVWQRSLGGNLEEICNDVLVTPDSFVLAAGSSYSDDGDVIGHHGSTDSTDAWLVKLDASGNLLWQLSAGGSGTDVFNRILLTPDNNYVCFGYTFSTDGDLASVNTGGKKGWVLVVSPAGNILSNKVYDNIDNGIITTGGSIVLFGDNTVVKLDAAGGIAWQHNATYATGAPNIAEAPGNKVVTTSGDVFDVETGGGSNIGLSFPGTVSSMIFHNNTVLAATEQDENNIGGCIVSGDPIEFGDGTNHINNINYVPSNSTAIAATTWHINGCYGENNRYGDGKTTPAPLNGLAILPDDSYMVVGEWHNGYDSYRQYAVLGINGAYFQYGTDWEEFRAVDYFPGGQDYVAGGVARYEGDDVSGLHTQGVPDFWVVRLQGRSNTISGKVFMDLNSNNVQDEGEPAFNKATVLSTKPNSVVGSNPVLGNYVNRVDTGTYTSFVSLQNMPHYSAYPPADITTFDSSYGNVRTANFAIKKIENIRDYEMSLTAFSAARSGFSLTYQIACINKGTDTLENKQVRFVKDPHLSLVNTAPLFDAISGDTLYWNTSSLLPGDEKRIFVTMITGGSIPVASSDIITSSVFIDSTADGDTNNNLFVLTQTVTGSFDPNDKIEVHGDYISLLEVQNAQPLVYTIRFQNTGNDTAFNIFLRDTLDSRLQWATVEIISASHPYSVKVNDGRHIECMFQDIRLVDSFHNEPKSHGYITYRIKPKNNLVIGDVINNSAAIYFDFNAPVVTNTQKTKVVKTTAIWTGAINSIWENPGNWNINLVPDAESVAIIPAAVPHYPVINSNASCFALRVDKNASITVNEGFSLDVSGK